MAVNFLQVIHIVNNTHCEISCNSLSRRYLQYIILVIDYIEVTLAGSAVRSKWDRHKLEKSNL